MLFNSLHFALFFPTVVALHFATPAKHRWLVLLVASLVFYGASRPEHVPVLFGSAAIAWAGARILEGRSGSSRRRALAIALALEILLLAVFKYSAFFARTVNDVLGTLGSGARIPIPELALPVGISFFTFQASSYLIDTHRGAKATKNPLRFLLFKSFFPQLVAGPIERARNLMPQLAKPVPFDYARVTWGLRLVGWGLFKKMVIADRLATYVSPVYAHSERYAGAPLYLATLFFTYQIYCDFSGYTDIARGTAAVLGPRLQENFRRPLHATSLPDFWRRWHMSLMSWFFDYVYVPLVDGKRDAASRRRALFVVFLLSGAWHGAAWTFVVWGLIQGVYVVGSELTRSVRERVRAWIGVPEGARRLAVFRRLVTLHLVMLSFVFFRAPSLASAWTILSNMPRLLAPSSDVLLAPGDMELMFGGILALELVEWGATREDFSSWLAMRPAMIRWPIYAALTGSILVFGRFEENTFLYFDF